MIGAALSPGNAGDFPNALQTLVQTRLQTKCTNFLHELLPHWHYMLAVTGHHWPLMLENRADVSVGKKMVNCQLKKSHLWTRLFQWTVLTSFHFGTLENVIQE